jgi:hypothetical protein
MRAGAAIVITLVGLCAVARAGEPLERCGFGGYAEPSALVGTSTRLSAPGVRTTSFSALFEVGGGLSYRDCSADRRAATRLQLGLHLSVGLNGTTSYNGAGGFGFEAVADHTIVPGWRLGGVTSIAFGNEYRLYTLGARLHYRDWAWVGLELLRVQTEYVYDPCSHPTTTVDGCQASVTGLYVGIGAEHRYVAYGTGVALVIGGVAAAIIAAGLGAVH